MRRTLTGNTNQASFSIFCQFKKTLIALRRAAFSRHWSLGVVVNDFSEKAGFAFQGRIRINAAGL
jgi:hypothetical protein